MTGNPIQWQDWGEQVFRASEDSQKPVLLTLGATWCHWCHIMDQTSYSDPRIVDLINSSFIPVRVDVDQRPDVSRRYNQGGYPSLAILDHKGTLITGRIYTPPDALLPVLQEISEGYPSAVRPGVAIDDTNYSMVSKPRTGPEDSPVQRVMETLKGLYDPEFGGFGKEPKQPPWEGLEFLIARYSHTGDLNYLHMVTTTLDGMVLGLYDRCDQGFFRYSVSRDWKVPHYEKMVLTNAGLATAYLEAFQVTGQRTYRDAATGAIGYLLGKLYDPSEGLFYASQDAGEEYYRLPWKDRTPDLAPSIDKTFYADWNAAAAKALIKAHSVLDSGRYLEIAVRTLDRLWAGCWNPGREMGHIVAGSNQPQIYLVDQVQAARAILDLYQVTGRRVYLDRSVEIVQCARDAFFDSGAGFRDVSEGSGVAGANTLVEFQLLENSWMAEALMRLWQLTGEDSYMRDARATLEAFKTVAPGLSHSSNLGVDSAYPGDQGRRRMEDDEEDLFLPAGSAWGRAWDMLESGPVHMALVGDPSDGATAQLRRSIGRLYAPYTVVEHLSPSGDGDRIAELGFPTGGEPALYVCMNGICLAPLTNPDEIDRLREDRPWANHLAGGQ